MRRPLLTAALTLALVGSAAADTASDQAAAQRSLDAILPGATASVGPSEFTAGGERLTIGLPPSQSTDPLAVGDVNWRAGVAASDASRTTALTEVAIPGAFSVPLAGRDLPALSADEAQRRGDENLATLRSQLPAGAVTDARATVIPLTEEGHVAVLFEIGVADANALVGYADELEYTPRTDLPAEGVAVEVRDPAGHELGAWALPRIGFGSMVVDPAFNGSVTEARAWARPRGAPARLKRSARSVRIQVTGGYCDQGYDYDVVRHRRDVTVTVTATRLADASGTRCAPPFGPTVKLDLKGRLGKRVIRDGSADPPLTRYKRPTA